MSSSISRMLDAVKKNEDVSFTFIAAKSYRQLQHQEQRLEKEKQSRIRKLLLRRLIVKGINVGMTAFDKALSSESFYNNIVNACKGNPIEDLSILCFSGPMQRQLKMAGIICDADLQMNLAAFQALYEECASNVSMTDINLYQMVSKARLRQGGDISFSTGEQVSAMIDFLPNIYASDTVLEPSAGIGEIADAIREYTEHIDCVEKDYDFREILTMKGYEIAGYDFFEMTPEKKYNFVLMNPPFSEELRHIRHAYDFVADGGVLFTLCSPMFDTKHTKDYREFREWLNELDYSMYYNFPVFENKVSPLAIKIRKNVDDDL